MTLNCNPQLCTAFLNGPGLELNEQRGQKKRKNTLYTSVQSVSKKIQWLFWIKKENGITYRVHFLSIYVYLYEQACSVYCKTLLEADRKMEGNLMCLDMVVL